MQVTTAVRASVPSSLPRKGDSPCWPVILTHARGRREVPFFRRLWCSLASASISAASETRDPANGGRPRTAPSLQTPHRDGRRHSPSSSAGPARPQAFPVFPAARLRCFHRDGRWAAPAVPHGSPGRRLTSRVLFCSLPADLWSHHSSASQVASAPALSGASPPAFWKPGPSHVQPPGGAGSSLPPSLWLFHNCFPDIWLERVTESLAF